MRPALRLLLLALAPWALAALLILAARAIVPAEPCPCATDTECMGMHGGDGGPEPLTT